MYSKNEENKSNISSNSYDHVQFDTYLRNYFKIYPIVYIFYIYISPFFVESSIKFYNYLNAYN